MLELKDVSKIYPAKSGNVTALNKINLYFEEKGLVFITGKSGSGKTTLLNCIGGLDDFDGEIVINGKSTRNFTRSDFDSYRNTYIGFVFQEYNLLDSLTVEKNISLATELQGIKESSDAVKKILKKVDLENVEHRKPQELSGGQRQRVAIARALVKNPAIIMADEPTGALDTENGLQVIGLLKKLSKEKLVIVVSHDLELANKYADRIINLKDGEVESDISIIEDDGKDRNIVTKSTSVAIKRGAELTDDDLSQIKRAVKHKKDVYVTDNINIIEKKTVISKEEETSEEKPFLKTKMGIWDTIKLGLNTLKTKKIRMIITILLCAIAFSVFGIFDAMAIYDEPRMTANTIRASITPANVFRPQVSEKNGEQYAISVNDALLDSLTKSTGYDFKGSYDSYYFGVNQPLELTNNSIVCKISKYYYFQKLNGAVEFSPEDLEKYGFSVKYGKYPESFDEIAISEYFANCMVNWYYTYKDLDGENKDLVDFDDLVSHITDDTKAPLLLTLGPQDSRVSYKIVGIMDVGPINKKFDYLMNGFDESSRIDQNEFTNYVTNSFNLYGFMKLGFAEQSMLKYNTLSEHKNSAYSFWFTNRDTTKQFSNTYETERTKFYNFDSLKKYQTYKNEGLEEDDKTNYYFFIDENKTSLEGNEILIDAKQFATFYQDYIPYLKTLAKSTETNSDPYISQLQYYPEEIDNCLSIIASTSTTKEKLNALKTAVGRLNEIQDYADKVYGTQRTGSVLERILTVKKLDKSQYEPGTKHLKEVSVQNNEYKIVGFYNGLSTGQTSTFVMSTAGLGNLGISTMQGYYSSIIATDNGHGNINALSKMFLSSDGYTYKPANVVVDMIRADGEFFSNLSLLFLIVSAVFALFSIAMFSNSISSIIRSKYVEIGILRALGAKGRDIFKMFLVTVLTISLINIVFASIVSGVGCIFVNMFLAKYLGLYVPLANFGIRQVLIIFGLSLGVGVVSASMPLISVSKQKPVETIRKAF